MATLFGMFPFLQKLFADGGYQGPEFSTALAKVRPHLNVEIVKRSDQARGFVVAWIGTTMSRARNMPAAKASASAPRKTSPVRRSEAYSGA